MREAFANSLKLKEYLDGLFLGGKELRYILEQMIKISDDVLSHLQRL